MKAGWEVKTLNEVCIVERGSSPRPIKDFFTTASDGVNWIKISDTEQDGRYVLSTAQKITQEGAKQSRYVKIGDFILTNSMSFGRPYIMKIDGYIHDGWFALRLKDSLNADYFYHLLFAPLIQNQFRDLAAGAIVKNISGDLVKKTKLPMPSVREQQRIAAILDEAFESIATAKANAEKNLKNARELFESHLQSVYSQPGQGWEEKSLSEVNMIRPQKSEAREKIAQDDLVTFMPMECLGKNQKNAASSQTRTLKEVSGSYTYFAEGDVLLAKITPCFENGKLGIAENLVNGIGFGSSEFIVFRPKNLLMREWLYYFLLRQSFRNDGAARMTGAVGHKRVSKEFVEGCIIPIPPIETQRKLIVAFEALHVETQRLESLYQQKIAALDELKKSLLHKAFSGEL